MKILFISNLYPPEVLGGYEILCEQVAGEFVQQGHEVYVQTVVKGRQEILNSEVAPGRHGEKVIRDLLLYLPFGKKPRRARARHVAVHFCNERVTARLLKRIEPDIVFFWSLRRLSLGSLRAVIDSGRPYALTLNDDNLLAYAPTGFEPSVKKIASILAERTLARTTVFRGMEIPRSTAISKTLKDNMLAAGAPLMDCEVIYQGVDTSCFVPKAKPGLLHKPARLLYVGQLHEYKGVHTVIEAAAILAASGRRIKLSIAGSGLPDYEKHLHRLVKDKKLLEHVEFLGQVAREELPELYRANDIFVFPSIWEEPFGLTHLEAMASGTAVISTIRGGPGEFLVDEKNSLTFEADDKSDLALKLERLISDDALRRKIARQGLQQVREEFSLSRYALDLERFLKNIVENWQ